MKRHPGIDCIIVYAGCKHMAKWPSPGWQVYTEQDYSILYHYIYYIYIGIVSSYGLLTNCLKVCLTSCKARNKPPSRLQLPRLTPMPKTLRYFCAVRYYMVGYSSGTSRTWNCVRVVVGTERFNTGCIGLFLPPSVCDPTQLGML